MQKDDFLYYKSSESIFNNQDYLDEVYNLIDLLYSNTINSKICFDLNNKYHNEFALNNSKVLSEINNNLNLNIFYFSPFNRVAVCHLFIILYFEKILNKKQNKKEINDLFNNFELLIISFVHNENYYFFKLLLNSKTNLKINEFENLHKNINIILIESKTQIEIIKSDFNRKLNFKKFVSEFIENNNENIDLQIVNHILNYPSKLINDLIQANNYIYNRFLLELEAPNILKNEIRAFISSNTHQINAQLFFNIIKMRSIDISKINKSESIRQFYKLFNIEAYKIESIVKSFSNFTIVDETKKIPKQDLILEYLSENQINFKEIILKKIKK